MNKLTFKLLTKCFTCNDTTNSHFPLDPTPWWWNFVVFSLPMCAGMGPLRTWDSHVWYHTKKGHISAHLQTIRWISPKFCTLVFEENLRTIYSTQILMFSRFHTIIYHIFYGLVSFTLKWIHVTQEHSVLAKREIWPAKI